LEKANREGDGELLLRPQSREALAKMSEAQKAAFPKRFPADPGLQYVPLAVGASGSHKVVIGRMDGSATNTFKYEAVKFLLEDGAWKATAYDGPRFDDEFHPDGNGLLSLCGNCAVIPHRE
jgi:hypothetical protein